MFSFVKQIFMQLSINVMPEERGDYGIGGGLFLGIRYVFANIKFMKVIKTQSEPRPTQTIFPLVDMGRGLV